MVALMGTRESSCIWVALQITKPVRCINSSEKELKNLAFPVAFDQTKVGKTSWFVSSWLPFVGPVEEAILLVPLFTIRGLNVYGVMFTGAFVPITINYSMKWKH